MFSVSEDLSKVNTAFSSINQSIRKSSEFYAQSTSASGGICGVYNSSRPQNGSGILSSIASFLTPIGKRLIGQIGRRAVSKVPQLLSGVALDALRGKRIGGAMKNRSRDAVLEALSVKQSAPVKKLKQRGVKRPGSSASRKPIKKTSSES